MIAGEKKHGSIPACAGEPRATRGGTGARRVYPRVCGGTGPPIVAPEPRGGLSPRVRGNRDGVDAAVPCLGSIPACAGEPTDRRRRRARRRVYPRVCGGTSLRTVRTSFASGLSPRVRGNRPDPREDHHLRGSIPACAGEPSANRRSGRRARVYPRVCGGTDDGPGVEAGVLGLSPRVRGNPHHGTIPR